MKRLLCAILTGLTIIGLVGCSQASTTVTEDPTTQEQVQENKLAQSTADKANKALDYINEYINAYREYGEARQNGTKSNATSGLTAEELMDIPYGSLFGQENYIKISDSILNHENIEIEMTSDDYNQYDEDKLMQINSELDRLMILASNEIVFDASELTKETAEEKPQQKQEQPQIEEEYIESEHQEQTQMRACMETQIRFAETIAVDMTHLSQYGSPEDIINRCSDWLTGSEGLRQDGTIPEQTVSDFNTIRDIIINLSTAGGNQQWDKVHQLTETLIQIAADANARLQ